MTLDAQAQRSSPIRLLQRFVRRHGVAWTAAAGGLVSAAASALLCYSVYLLAGWRFTPMALAMPVVAPLLLAPSFILILATALLRMEEFERTLHRALEASRLVLWEADLRAGSVSLSKGWATFIGAPESPRQVTFAALAQLAHPDDLDAIGRARVETLKGQRAEYAIEHRVRARSGDWRWVLSRGRVTERDPQTGRALRMSGTNVDITERKLAEEALRRREEQLSAAQAMAHVGNWSYDLASDEIEWSDEIYRIFGREPRSFVPRFHVEYLQATHPADRQKLADALAHVLATRQPHQVEHRILRPDASERVIDVRAQVVQADAGGSVVRLAGVVQDVTVRRAAQDALRQLNDELEERIVSRTGELRDSERRLRELIDRLPIVVLVKDRHARYLLTNRLNAEILGLSPERMLGRTSKESGWNSADSALVDAADAAARASGMPQVIPEFVVGDREGRRRIFRNTRIPFHYSLEHPDAILGVAVEITELKQAEAQLRGMNLELERRVEARTAELRSALRELESFSYSVSHDLRAPARAVAGFARIVIDDYGAQLPAEGRRLLARICEAGVDMGAMVDGLLELIRISRGELRRRPVDLVALAAGVWRDLAAAEPGRKVELHLDAELRPEGDPVLLRNLLLNLLGNARKYTRHRGDAAVWFGRTPEGEYYVRDNGVGFDLAHAAKLFGAFQRLHTEREFEGHGIGLALARKIVERHGGTIRAEAEPGRGAAFYFTLAEPPGARTDHLN